MLEGFQSVALVDELPPGQSKVVTVNNREIALFNIEGVYFAIHNRCPHEGGPLCEGRVKGFVVGCRWHGLALAVRNGQGAGGGGDCVGTYALQVGGGELLLGRRRRPKRDERRKERART